MIFFVQREIPTRSAMEYWPASSTINTSNASTTAICENVYRVPPLTAPLWSRIQSPSFSPDTCFQIGLPFWAMRTCCTATPDSRIGIWYAACDCVVTATESPRSTSALMMRPPRYDFPVPGGPWTTKTSPAWICFAASKPRSDPGIAASIVVRHAGETL